MRNQTDHTQIEGTGRAEQHKVIAEPEGFFGSVVFDKDGRVAPVARFEQAASDEFVIADRRIDGRVDAHQHEARAGADAGRPDAVVPADALVGRQADGLSRRRCSDDAVDAPGGGQHRVVEALAAAAGASRDGELCPTAGLIEDGVE